MKVVITFVIKYVIDFFRHFMSKENPFVKLHFLIIRSLTDCVKGDMAFFAHLSFLNTLFKIDRRYS